MNAARRFATLSPIAAVLLLACGGTSPELEEASAGRALVGHNGITRNGITRNGITRNGITRNGAPDSSEPAPIVRAGIDGQSFSSDDEAATLELLPYLIGCALESRQEATVTVNGVAHAYTGELGLTPQWQRDPCDGSCQGWVSACLLARTNATGASVSISLRGNSPPLQTSLAERAQYSLQEAGFFGNIFAADPTAYACMGRMFDTSVLGGQMARLSRRVCAADSGEECGLEVLGPCVDFVSPPWTLGRERVCLGEAFVDGAFLDCVDALGTPNFPAGSSHDYRVITTFLSPANLPDWTL